MSDDPTFSHLGDAITDEIIMQLYKIKTFKVRSKTSVMQYKNTEKEIPVIGEELNVNYLLDGSAQRHEDHVRIRIHLYHASTDDQIWGDIFAIAGKREKALEFLDRYLELSEKEFVPPTTIANVYMGMGEIDKAFEWLEKTYDQREAGLKELNVNPI